MQPCFLVVYGTYTTVFVALYCGDTQLALTQETHKLASKNFTLMVDHVFAASKKTWKDLSFLAANRGPGPFTTLRTVLALVNGLAYATQLPLIGVDNLNVFVREYAQPANDYTCALLNAFCDDVYYAQYEQATDTTVNGCMNIAQWIEQWQAVLQKNPSIQYSLIGNGVLLHYPLLQHAFNNTLPEKECIAENASVNAIALTALQHWQNNEQVSNEIMPLYLKEYSAKLHNK